VAAPTQVGSSTRIATGGLPVRASGSAQDRPMKRQTRQTWILLAVVAALGLAAIGETVRDRRNAPRPLLADSAHIDTIALECAQCAPRRFQRVQGRWDMVAPWVVPADPREIDRLLGLATAPVRRRFAINQVDPATLGFVPPFAVVQLGKRRIEFGTTDPINHARYVRSGDTVAVIADRISVVLLEPPERFVDAGPFAGLHNGVVAITEAAADWPAAQVQALAALRADEVRAAAEPLAGRALLVRDGAGRNHRYLLARDGERMLLRREEPPLGYVLPLGTTLPGAR